MTRALNIIHDEHRRSFAVLHCLQSLLQDIRDGRARPDFELLDSIVEYLSSFLFRYHHPKEDDHLFRALRRRDPDSAALLDALEEEHLTGGRLLRELRGALQTYRREGEPALPGLLRAAEAYHHFEWQHMSREEREVLPRARERLTAEDWKAIDAAFTAHDDPLFGDVRRQEFQRLYTVIVSTAPAPHGLGPAPGGA